MRGISTRRPASGLGRSRGISSKRSRDACRRRSRRRIAHMDDRASGATIVKIVKHEGPPQSGLCLLCGIGTLSLEKKRMAVCKKLLAGVAVSIVGIAGTAHADTTLLNVSYDVTRELYKD